MYISDLKDYQSRLDERRLGNKNVELPGNRLRINLSPDAADILRSDMVMYGIVSAADAVGASIPSGFINRLFLNFHGEAESSVDVSVARERQRLNELLSKMPDAAARSEAVGIMLAEYEARLSARINERLSQKGADLNPHLDQDCMAILGGIALEHGELYRRYYDDNAGRYIKAVIEEYASLPYDERELIYYKADVNILNSAASGRRSMLKMTLRRPTANEPNGVRIAYVKPVGIMTDSERLYNYLYGMISDSLGGSWSNVAVRLTNIISVNELKADAFISKAELDCIERTIRTIGVQFLSGTNEIQRIVVRFTDRGLADYARMRHLRPQFTRIIDRNTYEFNCTPYKAKIYFFKFGEDARILEPQTLADEMRAMYSAALNRYEE